MLKHDFRPPHELEAVTLPRAETRPLRPSQRSVMERAASIDAARSPEAALSPPKDPARAQAVERLLIDVIRGKQEAASPTPSLGRRPLSSASLQPTMDPEAARELLASSRVLGTLQRESMEVSRRVSEILDVEPVVPAAPAATRDGSPDPFQRGAARGGSGGADDCGADSRRADQVVRAIRRRPLGGMHGDENQRLAEQIGEVVHEWTERALEVPAAVQPTCLSLSALVLLRPVPHTHARSISVLQAVLEAYHGISHVAETVVANQGDGGERRRAELAAERLREEGRARLAAQEAESARQLARLRLQLVARCAAACRGPNPRGTD